MKYYVYSDTLGEGDFADSYDEAVKIAKEYAVHNLNIDDENPIEVQIFKLCDTVAAITTIEFITTKAKENE